MERWTAAARGFSNGTSGVAYALARLSEVSGEERFLDGAPAGGIEWIHAENRVEPYWKQSFVGYMQGAAGIGSAMLRLVSHGTTAQWKVRLPDAPALPGSRLILRRH